MYEELELTHWVNSLEWTDSSESIHGIEPKIQSLIYTEGGLTIYVTSERIKNKPPL